MALSYQGPLVVPYLEGVVAFQGEDLSFQKAEEVLVEADLSIQEAAVSFLEAVPFQAEVRPYLTAVIMGAEVDSLPFVVM